MNAVKRLFIAAVFFMTAAFIVSSQLNAQEISCAHALSEIQAAAMSGKIDKVKTIVAKNPGSVNEWDSIDCVAPLHRAAEGGHLDVVKFLIERGADVNAQYSGGYGYMNSPLHSAVAGGKKEIVELLIVKGARINSRNKAGHTPLGLAKFLKNYEMANFLRSRGGKE
ncbi:MAG: ankyrin repeat domain-containing protein [Candidatus Xenobiia bacterium LiM19]